MSVKDFFFSVFSSGGHLVQWNGAILAISVQGHERNIYANYFETEPSA